MKEKLSFRPRRRLNVIWIFGGQMHPYTVDRASRGVGMRDGWKFVCTPGHDWLLFDTFCNPFEQANYVFDRAFQDQKERCHARRARWIGETGGEFTLPEIG